MQRISDKVERLTDKATINFNGTQIWLSKITAIEGQADSGEDVVYHFSDGVYPPCTVISYEEPCGYTSIISSLNNLADTVLMFDSAVVPKGVSLRTSKETQIEMFKEHLHEVACQLGLELLEIDNKLVIITHLMQEHAKSGKMTFEEMSGYVKSDRDFAAAASSMGAATLLGEVFKTAMNIFNKVNFTDKTFELAEIIRSMRKMDNDGDVKHLSISDVETVMNMVKAKLQI